MVIFHYTKIQPVQPGLETHSKTRYNTFSEIIPSPDIFIEVRKTEDDLQESANGQMKADEECSLESILRKRACLASEPLWLVLSFTIFPSLSWERLLF